MWPCSSARVEAPGSPRGVDGKPRAPPGEGALAFKLWSGPGGNQGLPASSSRAFSRGRLVRLIYRRGCQQVASCLAAHPRLAKLLAGSRHDLRAAFAVVVSVRTCETPLTP